MPKLILLRHFKSQWNKENRFTGWVDVPLAKGEQRKAKEVAAKIFKFKIDKIYTSPLFRNVGTVARLLEGTGKYPIFVHLDGGKRQEWASYKKIGPIRKSAISNGAGEEGVPVFVSEKLNEKHYGKLQGENKASIMKKYGKEKVRAWRRSYNAAPPGGESLRDVFQRTIPFYKKFIERDLKKGKNVLVVASHNSLRAIVKHVEKISDNDIINLEIPFAGIKIYG